MRLVTVGIALSVLGASVAAQAVVVHENVPVPMSDGVELNADVYLPSDGTSFSTILARTPYDKRGKRWLAEGLVRSGYAVVLQDVRGKGASGGTFEPIVNERRDGLETLDWIVEQGWCNGRVGMWGTSYVAFCALILAPEEHPALRTIVNMSGWGDTVAFTYPGGAMHLMLALTWSLSSQIHGAGGFRAFDWPELFRGLPVANIPASVGITNDVFVPMVTAIEDARYREDGAMLERVDHFRIPALHVTGWYDFVGRETLEVYERVLSTAGAGEQRLLVGPWAHDQAFTEEHALAGVDFGPAAVLGTEGVIDLVAAWFDEHLEGLGGEATAPVRLFVLGANEWRDFESWPPAGARRTPWFLTSEAGANGLDGDGALVARAPIDESEDSYLYDPSDPVPTTGGASFHFFTDLLGPTDQRPVEGRGDVLVYTSAPTDAPFEVIGPVEAIVHLASEGRTTDVTAKLVLVEQGGTARILADGIRRGPDELVPGDAMQPGIAYRFTVDLGSIAQRVNPGQRLRVEISSSNFPKYSRNPNTGERSELATELVPVAQRIVLGGANASRVVLPIVGTR